MNLRFPNKRSSRPAVTALMGFLIATGMAAGCGGINVTTLPSPESPPPSATPPSGLHAGFGRADITPPPGVSLAGNGPEARQSEGYRHRLYARSIVLEDRRGERLALVVADLPLMSPVVHRLVAVRTLARHTGIGADRLILSVTHTHAGPGNFFGATNYNFIAGALSGYDERMVSFLVDRIATSIEDAVSDLRPAIAAWDTLNVTGLTRNRSLEAFERNTPPLLPPRPQPMTPAQLERRQEQAVDTVMTMLRVDRCYSGPSDCHPMGAYSIFAIHATGYPAANRLLDGDIPAIVARGLESHIASLNPNIRSDPSKAVHLFANGTEGDVSPKHFAGTRCERRLKQEIGLGPGGPWRPLLPEVWRAPAKAESACLELARRSVNTIGDQLGARAVALFDRIGPGLANDLEISRAFTTLHIPTMHAAQPLCSEPRTGLAQAAGSIEDAGTRMHKWRVLGLISTDIEEGGGAEDKSGSGCQGAKREMLQGLQGPAVGEFGLPKYIQLTVAEIGGTLLAAVPFEATTTAGMRMKTAMRSAIPNPVEHVSVVSLANGYLSYVTTREEYSAQHYEGGSTLYGPNSAAAFTDQLARLAGSLGPGQPIVEVDPMIVDPGRVTSYFAPPDRGPAAVKRRIGQPRGGCSGLVATWVDEYPGALLPADGPVLTIETETGTGNWTVATSDDHRSVEVRAKGQVRGGYKWEVRWLPDQLAKGRYRVALLPRQGRGGPLSRLESEAITCP